MTSGPCIMTVSTTTRDDLFQLIVAPMTPRSDRRALMGTYRSGDTRSRSLYAAAAPATAEPDAAGHRPKPEGDRVYEHG